ncbi:MAG: L,D-transpeptidase, partial [Rhizobiaceae bacterium]
MVSRRFLLVGLAALGGALGTSTANAGSILDLFAPPEQPVIIKKRKLPGGITVRKTSAKKKPALRNAKKTSAKKSGKPFKIDPRFEPQEVHFASSYKRGTIVVNSNERFLYLVTGPDSARRYGVAIGKEGLGWKGTAVIKAKVEWPNLKPTPAMIKRSPEKYA